MKNSLLLIFLLSGMAIFGQDSSEIKAKKILDIMSKEIKSLQTIKLDFISTLKGNGLNEKTSGSATVKGNDYYINLGDQVLINHANKSWTIIKSEKSIYESTITEDDEDFISPVKLLTIWEEGYNPKYIGEGTEEGKPVHVIELYPKEPKDSDIHTIQMMVNRSTNELMDVIIKSKDGTHMEYQLTKFIKNPTVSENQFKLSLQRFPGYKLIKD